jgi:hypothetical protein
MANEIYNSTWWGNPQKNGWGGIYYDYAFDFPLINYFIDRVEADGGIIESSECVSQALSILSIYNWDYNFRVESDGGKVESLECVTNY